MYYSGDPAYDWDRYSEDEIREAERIACGAVCDDCKRVKLRGWESHVKGTPPCLGACLIGGELFWCDLGGVVCEEFVPRDTMY